MGRRSQPLDEGHELIAEADKVLDYALTAEEKGLCTNVLVFGPEFLRQAKGWKSAAIKKFLERTEVVREINTLKRQYEDRSGLQERTQFTAQMQINSMVPAATHILAKCLRGPIRKEDGEIIMPPTKQQFEAAVEVLDRANVQGQKFGNNDSTPSIDARAVAIAVGAQTEGSQDLDASGREKVRLVLNSTLNRIRSTSTANAMADSRKETIEKRFKTRIALSPDPPEAVDVPHGEE